MILEGLRPLATPIANLRFDPENARTHDPVNIGAIKSSLSKFTQRKAIVAKEDGTVIAGNGTLQAAIELGWKEVAVVFVKDDPTTARAFALADNRTAELAGWNPEVLSETLKELSALDIDMSAFGFDEADIMQSLDYGALNSEDIEMKMEGLASGVRKAIQIEFEPDHYEEAAALVKLWRSRGAYVGMLLIEKLREQADASQT